MTAADGGRLKLEWGTLRARSADRVQDLLWWEAEQLLGFLGLYVFGSSLELAGMVDPAARGRGIGTALLDAAARLCSERGIIQALLIVPRASEAGKHLALRRGATLDHSEHAMVLPGDPAGGPADRAVSLRPATLADIPIVSGVLAEAFGAPAPANLADRLGAPQQQTMVIEAEGAPVGTLLLTHDGDEGRIYGFAVDPAHQGRGIGRAALRRACQELCGAGARRIGLEVAVDNDRALGLYTSVGFTPVITEDYYALPVS